MTRRLGTDRALTESIDALTRRIKDYPIDVPEPSCATCEDTGWVFLIDGAVTYCPHGCVPAMTGLPPTPTLHAHEPNGPESF